MKKETMRIQDYINKQPLLFDGAMGTYFAGCHPDSQGQAVELYNISHPEWIRQIHMEYLEAGAAAIKTNTFAAYSCRPMASGQGVSMERLLQEGYRIASRAVQEYEETHRDSGPHFVFADIGPLGLEEGGLAVYQKMADIFLDSGASCFLFETMDSAEDLAETAAYIKQKRPDAFIVVSFAVSPEGFTRGGCFGRSLFRQMQEAEAVDAVGFNCISGPKHLLELVQKLDVSASAKYLSVMPNAGYPTIVDNRTLYADNPAYFAEAIQEIADRGVAILGGCCGTEPSYIEQIRSRLTSHPVVPFVPAKNSSRAAALSVCQNEQETAEKARYNPRNDFAAKLLQGEKVIVVELDPPMTPEVDVFMEGAARYKRAGVDAIDIADCPIARARIDSSILACKVKRELNLTAIPHLTCRDRNINATKALLLGLNVEGINNVLTVTGDPVPAAQRQEVKTMFSYNSAVLARHINTLNETSFIQNPFMVCGALNVNAVHFESQLHHARKKIENGVSVLFTQPVMTERGLENLKRARKELPVKILGGLIPVVSYRNACFMQHEIAGIDVDERIIEQYRDKNREEGEELAVQIVLEISRQIADYVDGYYLITPFQRIALMERIIQGIKSQDELD